METQLLISQITALISIIIYGVIWLNENFNNKEHKGGLVFLIITWISCMVTLITLIMKI